MIFFMFIFLLFALFEFFIMCIDERIFYKSNDVIQNQNKKKEAFFKKLKEIL